MHTGKLIFQLRKTNLHLNYDQDNILFEDKFQFFIVS